jgi:hypothetical protein
MTIRSIFDLTKRRVMIVALLGFCTAVIGVLLAQHNFLNVAPYHAALPGGIVFALALLYANLFAFRCPHCSGQWGVLAMQISRGLFSVDSRIRYCPFCGCTIDRDLGSAVADPK